MAAYIDPDVIYYNYNYYIKGDLAYTEDHVLVHKLFVYKIPRKITAAVIREYFSSFGHIVDIHVTDKRRYRGQVAPNVAFVEFENPKAAAKALKVDRHVLCGTRVLVKVCDSWHQPSAERNCQPNKSNVRSRRTQSREDDNQMIGDSEVSIKNFVPPKKDSILFLNDYCLENIIQRLPLRSQVCFARSCTRIRQVFKMTSKLLHRILLLERLSDMTLWEIRDFFDFAGEYIVRIEGELPDKYRQRIVEFMGTYCSNVEELHLESSALTTKTLNNLFIGLPNVVDMRLHYCSLTDSSVMAIRKLGNLKTLNLSENFKLSGKNLNALSPTVESLSLKDCSAVHGRHIISLCAKLTNLKELNLEQCFCLNAVVFNAMAASCQNLETLTMSIVQSDYELVAKLPKLKNLTIYISTRHTRVRPSLFTELVEHKSQQLEFFHIVGFNCVSDEVAAQISHLKALRTLVCPNNEQLTENGLKYFCDLENLEEIVLRDCRKVDNTSLLRLALKCTKLKRIHVQRCPLVTDSLIFELIQKMRKQIQYKTFLRTEPISLMVESTKIKKFILNDPEYVASADLVVVYINNTQPDLLKHDDFFFDRGFDDDADDLNYIPEIDDLYPEEQDDEDLFNNSDFIFSDDDDDVDDEFMDNVVMLDGQGNQRNRRYIPG